MKKLSFLFLFATAFLLNACQKEVSNETGTTPSDGLLQSDVSGDCLPKNVVGTYEQGTVLNGTTNYIEVTVDVITAGAFTIYSDTSNGVFFRATGIFTTTGPTVVKLRGNMTPAAAGLFNFIITYNNQFCSVPVTFLPAGAGGPAAFTINCTPQPTPAGTYGAGVPLTATNKVVLNVNVTTIGTYNISTTAVNGMTFTGSGAVSTTGATTIELTGTGTPTAAGTFTVNVTVGTSSCNFPVVVSGAAVFSLNCASAFVDGDFIEGTPLTPASTVEFDVNVTTAGAYTLTTTAVNGMVFFGSGTLATGAQTITLTASGTPVADGNFNITVPTSPTCTFAVDVEPGSTGSIDWKFTEGSTTYQGSTDITLMTVLVPPMTVFLYSGANASDDIAIAMSDATGGFQVNETYLTSASPLANAADFEFVGATTSYSATSSTPGVAITVKVTAHNTTTKTISGTFSGTVKDAANVTKTITNGTFTCTYP